MKYLLLLGFLACLAPSLPALDLTAPVNGVVSRHLLADLNSGDAKKSIRGTKALWTQLSVQKPVSVTAMENLEADIKTTDMEGELRNSGFKVMDPKKRSLALGLRPTLMLNVLYCPKGTEGNDVDFYLVLAKATQDVTPLGGDTVTLTTWMKVGDPIASTGDAVKDVNAIRASARACVLAFIDVAQDNDGK